MMQRMKPALGVVGLAVLLLAATGAWYGWHVRATANEAVGRLRALTAQLESARAAASGADDPTLLSGRPDGAAILQVCQDFGALDRSVRPLAVVARVAAPLARAGVDVGPSAGAVAARLDLVQAAQHVTAAIAQACDALDPLLRSRLDPDLQIVLTRLARERGTLRSASERLQSAQSMLVRIDESQLSDNERQVTAELKRRLPDAAGALSMLASVPDILGYDRPATYLVLGQNSDELRPTGGFIGTSGYLTLDRGRVVASEYGSSFLLNVPPDRRVVPPAPLQRYMQAQYWHLQEANWWPDYPSSAKQAQFFSDLAHPADLAGVVAVNQGFVASLLEITGPLKVEGYDESVDSTNVRQRLDYQVHVISGAGEAERKRFVSAVFTTLMHRLASMQGAELRRVPEIVLRSLQRQDLLVSLNDPQAAQATAMLHWDGRMLSAAGDYLYVVSSNLGANKVNRDVSQDLQYDVVSNDDGRLVGHVHLDFTNRHDTSEYWPYDTTDYVNYLRVYVPAGSELISSDGRIADVATSGECGKTAISGLVRIPSGQQGSVDLRYRLPADLTSEGYRLLVQKQPGVESLPMTVQALGGRVELGDDVRNFRVLQPSGGQLSVSRQLPIEPTTQSAPACQVSATPPIQLTPPVRIVVPRLDLDARVEPLGISPSGVPQIPATASVAGWYSQSARPGQAGNAVLVGRPPVNAEPAVFDRLGDLADGAPIDVIDESGTSYRYAVQWVRRVDQASGNLAEIMGPTRQNWLTLITWSGGSQRGSAIKQEWTVVRATLERQQ